MRRLLIGATRIDTGDIAPEAVSVPMTLTAAGPYHCTIHPSMVGTVYDR
jgi:hypothetical protein